MRRHRPNANGFTLLEVVLSVAILGILLAIGVPVFLSYLNRNDLDVSANVLVSDLYRAQSQSRDNDNSDSWGVYATNGKITLFRGPSYASRVVNDDQNYTVPSTITVSGNGEYVFAKFTGLPQTTGTTTLRLFSADSRAVTINQKGMIEH